MAIGWIIRGYAVSGFCAVVVDGLCTQCAFPQADFHLRQNRNRHFTLYSQGHDDFYARKIGEPPRISLYQMPMFTWTSTLVALAFPWMPR